MTIIPRLFFYRCFWEFTDWFPLTGQENTILKELSLLLRMNALQWRVHAGKFLFLFFFCFRFPWGLHTSCSDSPFLGEALSLWREEKGPEPHGQGGGELRLLCVWAAHFVFSSAHVCHSWALESSTCRTLTPGKIPFLPLLPFTMTFLCQLLLLFLTVFLCLGALHLIAAQECWTWLGWENWRMGNGSAGKARVQTLTEKQ